MGQACITKKEAIQKELEGLSAGKDGEKEEVDALYGKREALNKTKKDKIQERADAKDKFKEEQKAFRDYQNELRAERQKKIEEERKTRQQEYEKREKEKKSELANQEPHVEDRALVNQCIVYIKSLMPKEAKEEKEEKKDIKGFEEKGLTMVTPKDDRDEFYFVPTKVK